MGERGRRRKKGTWFTGRKRRERKVWEFELSSTKPVVKTGSSEDERGQLQKRELRHGTMTGWTLAPGRDLDALHRSLPWVHLSCRTACREVADGGLGGAYRLLTASSSGAAGRGHGHLGGISGARAGGQRGLGQWGVSSTAPNPSVIAACPLPFSASRLQKVRCEVVDLHGITLAPLRTRSRVSLAYLGSHDASSSLLTCA